MKPLLLFTMDLVEGLTEHSVDHFLCAEYAYPQELNLPDTKTTVVANKYQPMDLSAAASANDAAVKFVFSGTLAPGYGLLETIDLIIKWHEMGHQVTLRVIGVVYDPKFRQSIKQAVKHKTYICCTLQHTPVPHLDILESINNSDYGIVAHQPNASNVNCVPTRIYEFLALRKPFLLQRNPLLGTSS